LNSAEKTRKFQVPAGSVLVFSPVSSLSKIYSLYQVERNFACHADTLTSFPKASAKVHHFSTPAKYFPDFFHKKTLFSRKKITMAPHTLYYIVAQGKESSENDAEAMKRDF